MNKLLILALGLSLVAFGLAACQRGEPGPGPTAADTPAASPAGATPTPGQAAADPTLQAGTTPSVSPEAVRPAGTVTIWHAWDETRLPALLEVIETFSEDYPDIYFDVLYLPQEILLQRYQTAVQEGRGPSLLLGPANWGPALAEAGQIAELSELAGDALLARLNPAALDTGRYLGGLYALPYLQQGVVLYRNRDLIGEAPATFDDLIAIVSTSTQGEVQGAILERSFAYSGGHLLGLGGDLMDEQGNPAFNTEAGLAWVDLLRDFSRVAPVVFQTDQDLEAFIAGRAGYIIEGTWQIENLIGALGSESVAIDPWPTYKNGALSGFVQAESLFLNAQLAGEQRQAAWLFADYLLSPSAQTLLAEVGVIPAASGVRVSDPLLSEALQALSGGVAYPNQVEMQAYSAHMDAALKSIFDGVVSPEEGLANAEAAITSTLAGEPSTPEP